MHQAVAARFPDLDLATAGEQIINPFSLNKNDGIQTRASTREKTVDEYIEAMRRGDSFPPATVFVVGGVAKLVDGFHRLEASRLSIGYTERGFAVDVRMGTARAALREALTANYRHGLRLTAADNESRFLLASEDAEYHQLSVRKLAALLGLSKSRVDQLRKRYAWTRPNGTGRRAFDPGEGELEGFSELGPLTIPYGKPQLPRPLSDLARFILDAAGEASKVATEKRTAHPGAYLAGCLQGAIEGVEVDGTELDGAARELINLGVWLWKKRQTNSLLTRPEIIARTERDAGADY
jgi:hypothetical protein